MAASEIIGSPRHESLVYQLQLRRRFLLWRREAYGARIREITQARADFEINVEEWTEAMEELFSRLEPIDREIDQINDTLRSLNASHLANNR